MQPLQRSRVTRNKASSLRAGSGDAWKGCTGDDGSTGGILCQTYPSSIPIAKPTLQEHQEDAMLSCCFQAPERTTREVKQPKVEEGSGQSPQKPQERRSAPKTTMHRGENARLDEHNANRALDTANGGKEQASEARNSEKTGRTGHRTKAESNGAEANGWPHTNTQKTERQEKRKVPPGSAPEVLVICDGNAPRIAGALHRIWDNTVIVKQMSERKATANRLQHLLRRHSEGESHGAGLVVLHAGIQDVLNGLQPGDIVQAIRKSVAPFTQKLVICSAPEVATRGKAMRAKAMLLNTELRKLCGALKVTFVDLSDTLAGEERLAQDGIHYLSATTRQVVTQLAQAIRPFLGLQRPRRSRDKSNRTPRRKSDPNVSSPTPETPAAHPPPQPLGMAAVTLNTPHREFRDNIQDFPHPMYLMNTALLLTQSTQPCSPRASPAPQTWIPHEGTTHPAMVPWRPPSPGAHPDLFHMVRDIVRQQIAVQWPQPVKHAMLPNLTQ
ncbi:hypothetical protein MRX96_038401 [Rhipicephalus microplus]